MPSVTAVRRELRAFAELLALCGFCVALPLLEIFGRTPEQFVFRDVEGFDVVEFGLAVVLVPPLVLWALEVVVGLLAPRLRPPVHLVFVGVLVAGFVIQTARPLVTGPLLLVLASAAGVGAALVYGRTRAGRLWLGYAAFAPLLFLGLFLTTSQASELITGEQVAALDVPVGSPAPVVMVVFDEFPLESIMTSNGEIDGELFPNFARLADDAHWFRNATAVSGYTWNSVPSMLTGMMPVTDETPLAFADDHPDNLFTLLGGTYELDVHESITRLCPTNLCETSTGLPGGRRELVGDAVDIMSSRLSFTGDWENPVAGLAESVEAADTEASAREYDADLRLPVRFAQLLDGIAATGDAPALHYLHLLFPHVPHRFLPSGESYEAPAFVGLGPDDVWTDDPTPVDLARQRHLLQVGYVDALLGDLISTLEDLGTYDESLLVVTGDHGISFRPSTTLRGFRVDVLDDGSAADLMWVPLFVKEPHQTSGTVSDTNVLLVDVLPTIADVLDAEVPWDVDGQSMLGPARRTTTKPYFGSPASKYGVVGTGPRADVDGPSLWPLVLDRGVDRFLPLTGDDDRFWRIGPGSSSIDTSLVGRTVDDVPDGVLVPTQADLLEPGDLVVDPTSGTVPAFVHGTLDELPAGTELAIAVNGVLRAVTRSFDDGGASAFAVMVGDEHFEPGPNTITVYAVR